jgi:shikimate kinase
VEPDNRGAINMDGLSVWLDVPIDVVLARIPADGRRPLAADRAQMERLFASRRAAYGLAHLRIEVGTASADEIAERIADQLSIS